MSRRRKSISRTTGQCGVADASITSLPDESLPLESLPPQFSMRKRVQVQRRLFPAVMSPPGNQKTVGQPQLNNGAGTFSLTGSQEELCGIMDKDERQVLRRKRNMIASHLELDKDCIKHLMNTKVINDTILIHIKTETNNYNKVTKMLEVMPIHGSIGVFQRLCSALETHTPWLAFELRTEMKMEKHELKVEKYVEHEAGLMVRRTFGGSRRLSQMEKDDIHHLVALRTQYAKEVWQMMLLNTRNNLQKEKTTNKNREKKIRFLLQSVVDYLNLQSSRLNTESKLAGNEDVSPIVKLEGDSLTDCLEERLGDLESLTTRALLDREALASERRRAMAVLTAAGTGNEIDPQILIQQDLGIEVYSACNQMSDLARPLMSFSAKIREALEKANAELIECKDELRTRDNKLVSLESQLARMSSSTQLQCRDKTIAVLTADLRECEDRLRDAKLSSDEFQRRVIVTKLEVAKYRTKADALEKTRRLGYTADKPLNNGISSSGPLSSRGITVGNTNTASSPNYSPSVNTPAIRRKRSAKKK